VAGTGPIVVGYDGTDGAKAALDEAIVLAKDLGAQLVLVFGYGVEPTSGEVQAQLEALRRLGSEQLSAAVEQVRAGGVEAEAELVDERSAEAVVQTAAARDARMVVVGSYGERPLAGALLGSTPHKLLHLSDQPVLVVRA
jgi:nucleotide-binding universal stress UspA family protein